MPNYREQYPQIAAAFPGVKLDGGGLSIEQGRVVFHQERLFRSTGAGQRAHAVYLERCANAGLSPFIEWWDREQCACALRIMEETARVFFLFRDCRTQWEEFTNAQ